MTCPECGGECKVTDVRGTAQNAMRRRRECLACGGKFTTYEVVADDSYVAQSMTVSLNYTRRKTGKRSRDPEKCTNGHIKAEVGRTTQGQCRACHREAGRSYDAFRYREDRT